jgi:hypothetical protein
LRSWPCNVNDLDLKVHLPAHTVALHVVVLHKTYAVQSRGNNCFVQSREKTTALVSVGEAKPVEEVANGIVVIFVGFRVARPEPRLEPGV